MEHEISLFSNQEFIDFVIEMVAGGNTYLEAMTSYAEDNELDIELLAGTITKNTLLMSKLQEECQELKLIERSAALPV